MTQPPAPDWSARLALTIAGEVRRHRLAQGLSAQQLAERCAQIGMPIQRSVLANLESGRRTTVNVAEVLVLAHALKVPPGVLIFPVGHVTHTEVLPDGATEPGFAIEWLAGRSFFDAEAAEGFFDTPLGLVRLHQDQVTTLRRTVQSRDHARREFADIATRFRDDEERYVQFETERAEIYRQIQEQESLKEQQDASFDPDRSKALKALYDRHSWLAEQRDEHADGARQYRYAAQRVDSLERSVVEQEAKLRELRDRMKNEDLQPPLLPKILAYLDPDRPAFEDIPEKKTASVPEPHVPLSLQTGELNIPMVDEDPGPLVSAEQADQARGILEEMKPYLADILAEAMEKYAKRKRDSEGE
ncbi:helix-turn-helix domain-containing protein [Streptomyces sp. NPDC057253]|uniref:helix-turn-helix domain-containing protein n=1 Tax=Streptomyces sp. NPDC057253 TaxID=3346069 RepID=UPI00363CF0FE